MRQNSFFRNVMMLSPLSCTNRTVQGWGVEMMRATLMVLALMALPTAPAAAVVAIKTASTAAETSTAPPAAATPPATATVPADNPFGLASGEMVAALVGLLVVSMTLMLGRQQHSVSS
jgi:hypothetical protein